VVDVDEQTLDRLADWDVPDDLRTEVTAEPHRYRLLEELTTTGAQVRSHQPGPGTPFDTAELKREELRANLTGCLVPMLLAAALLLLALAASVHME